MKILVAWDDPAEAELLQLYLGVGDNEVVTASTREDYLAQLDREDWSGLLLALAFPQAGEEAFALFKRTQESHPEVPVVMACRTNEMLQLPRFLTNGLRFYLVRDIGGDFV